MHSSNNVSRNSGKYDQFMKKPTDGIGGGYNYVEDRDVPPSRCSTIICSNDYCIFGIFCSIVIVVILYSAGLLNGDNGSHNTTNYSI